MRWKWTTCGFGIEQGEGGAPVSVARLSDRAGIDHVTRGRLQLQRDRLGLPDGAVFGTEAIGAGTVGEESALQVGVAEEGERSGERDERDERIADRNYVGIFVARASREPVAPEESLREEAGLAAESAAIRDARESAGRGSRWRRRRPWD